LIIVDNSLDFSKYDLKTITSNTKIFSLDLESHLQLNDLNISHEKLDLYLTSDDKIFIENHSIKIALEWYKIPEINELLKFDQLNLGSLFEQDLYFYLLKKLKFLFSLIRLSGKISAASIISSSKVISVLKILDSSKSFTVIDSISKDNSSSNLEKISLPVNILGQNKTFSFSYDKILKIIKIIESITSKFFNLKLDSKKPQKNPYILFLDLNPIPYRHLLNFLNQNNKQILFSNEMVTVSWKKSQIDILKKTNSKIFGWHDFENKQTSSIISKNKKIIQNKTNQIFSNDNFENFFIFESHSFWEIIRNEFIPFCMSRFDKSLELLELVKSFFINSNVDSIVTLYQNALENKIVFHIAEKMNIPCFRLQHGVDPFGSMEERSFPINYGSSHLKHLLWSENYQKYLFQLGLNENNTTVVGSSRYDDLFKLQPKNKSNKILLLSTFLNNIWSVNGYDSNFLDIHKEKFFKICKIVDSIEDKQLMIKLHPSMKIQYSIKSILNNINVNIPIYRTQELSNLLADSEVVICMDHSTSLIEAMILKKPTITFMTDSSWYENDSIITSGATLAVNSLDAFEKSLNRVLFDSNFRNELIERGTEYVINNLENMGNASTSIGKLLISKPSE
jgi:hypothetical protein